MGVSSIHEMKMRGVETMSEPTLAAWIARYLDLAIHGVWSPEGARKVALELERFRAFFLDRYGHERIAFVLRRDVVAWLDQLEAAGYAPATVNHHLAALSGFMTWVASHDPAALPHGSPTQGVSARPLPPLEPRALSDRQVQSLKNLCDRLPTFYQRKGRRWSAHPGGRPLRANARPYRDRAIVFVLLSTGIRREELVNLNLGQLQPNTPDALRRARRAALTGIAGKNRTRRDVFLSSDARLALADYLERERAIDARQPDSPAAPLFLSAAANPTRSDSGRLSTRLINTILDQIGRWHDAEHDDPARHISPLRPHDLRHTFAFRLARVTGADPYELERRLGHQSQRYIQRYTNPPVEVAAGYVEDF
jgi:integrase